VIETPQNTSSPIHHENAKAAAIPTGKAIQNQYRPNFLGNMIRAYDKNVGVCKNKPNVGSTVEAHITVSLQLGYLKRIAATIQ